MSIKQMCLVWDYEFDHSEQSVVIALADHAHDDGTNIRPSVARIAWKTGYSDRQVRRILAGLRDKGFLVLVYPSDRRSPNEYKFDWSQIKKKEPFSLAQNRGDNLSPLPKSGVTSEDLGVTSETVRGDIAVSGKPSLEPSYLNLNTPSISPPTDFSDFEGSRNSDHCHEREGDPAFDEIEFEPEGSVPQERQLENSDPGTVKPQTPENPPPLSTKPEPTDTGSTGMGYSAAPNSQSFIHPTQRMDARFRGGGQLLPWHTSHERYNSIEPEFVEYVASELRSSSHGKTQVKRSNAVRYICFQERDAGGLTSLYAMWEEYQQKRKSSTDGGYTRELIELSKRHYGIGISQGAA